MHIFYCPSFSQGGTSLDENESYHCVKVLRLHPETKINVIDGKGGFYLCEILKTNPKKVKVKILDRQLQYNKRDYYLHIGISPTKQTERYENFLDKAIEIGIDRITPIVCKRTERKKLRYDRVERVAQAAAKQSQNAFIPQLDDLTPFSEILNEEDVDGKYIASCQTDNRTSLEKLAANKGRVLILIGPEGDFMHEEVELANSKGFENIDLGANRLRTETAGIVVSQIIKSLNQLKQ
ncbi:MAG: 16S rRNA (uracil(1498)-N(3))-methyltransferase [Bacteroidia bacterium]|nr:16S rRNA (uracil(1498)-N(3))-methyltransferase [Bacteroidia bacterium]NNC85163.1 16S rRNA (uracil(1498)-N(3))-methyltransferase [Bacteroidia bacterium]NNM16069.1 16S rRNA (uracil(1498)-N(3))-methyltransferase [Bacteroidia bacterium]